MTDFIFQHGAMVGGFIWEDLIAAMQARESGHRYLALDVPGCGAKRGVDGRELKFDAIIDDLLADLDSSDMKDAVLIGHSQGGTVIPRLAEARPEMFARLIYIACLGPDTGQSVMEAAQPADTGEEAGPATIMEGLRTMLCNDMDVPTTRNFLAKLGGGDAWPPHSYAERDWRYDHLQSVASTYIFCNQDNCVPPERQEAFLANLHIDKVIRIDSGHQPMNSRPMELAELLLAEAR